MLMTYKLMIKTHNVTNKKYLCITKRDNHGKYLGSGVAWNRHLEKHGKSISTEVIYESDTYDDPFISKCQYYSTLYDVVRSDEWLNVIPENGYDSEEYGFTNFELFWKYADEESKKEIIERRNQAITENHWTEKSTTYEINRIKKAISDRHKQHWESMSDEEKATILGRKEAGFARFIEESGVEYEKWKTQISTALKGKPKSSSHCANISDGRINMTEEDKQKRKEKIRDVYATGKHDHLFERYSKERKGGNNPAAKAIEIDGTRYPSIQDAVDSLGLTRGLISRRVKSDSPRWKGWRYEQN